MTGRRPVVHVEQLPTGDHVAVCATGACDWRSPVHVVKAGAQEAARWHRDTHRTQTEGDTA